MKFRTVLLVIFAVTLVMGCGDEPTGPSGSSGITLTVEFTGDSTDTGKILSMPNSGAGVSSINARSLNGSNGYCEVTASWTTYEGDDFVDYTVYRSLSPDISGDPSGAEELQVYSSIDETEYVDAGVIWGGTYYYAIKVTGTESELWSNEVSITTPSLGGELPEGMEFVTIPEGNFEMGAPEGEPGSSHNERPVHTVTFDYTFEMMTTEVTQGMWYEVMGEYPSSGYGVGDDYPVYYVSWNDCQEFIDAMNLLDPSHTYRLPSESEWEYCCRAGTTTRFYWGEDPDETEIDAYAWFSGNAGSTAHPVAQKLPNDWGLYDMSGNVWEWCQDWYHSNYNGAPDDGSAWEDPVGSDRVSRGGSWSCYASGCRSAYRIAFSPGNSFFNLGFRLSRD